MTRTVTERTSLFDDVSPIPLRKLIVELQRVEAEIGTDAKAFVWTVEDGIDVEYERPMTAWERHKEKHEKAARVAALADGWSPRPWGVPDKYYPPLPDQTEPRA